MTMVTLNSSGYVLPNIPKITTFNSNTAKQEFNADWVSTSAFLPVENEFNKGFSVCSVTAFRKNDNAEVYVFFMIKNREKETYLVSDLIQVITFK